ncbi:Calcium permeable stress-gated cation channel 1 [Astathelohania contejeani]|uniref:Calcium permeable stress-gated cation channel 1 n=1 Tax=Astathelohania contejeani TaxID=164912 RepID=A0ABQ7HZ45_9MICR|nr:Calcium permeable stress-gated cation channel 1 [Thelohania contejeani]
MSTPNFAEISQRPPLKDSDNAIKSNLTTQGIIGGSLLVLLLVIRPKIRWLYSPNTRKRPAHPAHGYNGHFNWIIPVLTLKDVELLTLVGLDSFMILQTTKLLYRFFCILSLTVLPILGYFYWHGGNTSATYGQFFLRVSISNLFDSDKMLWLSTGMVYYVSLLLFYLIYVYYKKFVVLRQAFISNPASMTAITTIKQVSFELNSIEDAIDFINVPSRTVLLSRLPGFLQDDDDLRVFVEALGVDEVDHCFLLRNTHNLVRFANERAKEVSNIEREITVSVGKIKKWTDKHRKECEEKIKNYKGKNIIEAIGDGKVDDTSEKIKLAKRFITGGEKWKNKTWKKQTSLEYHFDRLKKAYETIQSQTSAIKYEEKDFSKDIVEMMDHDQILYIREDLRKDVSFISFHHLLSPIRYYHYFRLDLPVGTKSGFVTFRTQRGASIMAQCLIGSKVFACSAEPAPSPNDIIWSNINRSEVEAYFRSIAGTIIFVLFVLIFYSLVFALTGLTKLSALSKSYPGFGKFMNQHPQIKANYDGIVTPFIYNQLLTLSPFVLSILVANEGVISYSRFEINLMEKYSVFLFFNGFLALLFTSTFYDLIFDVFTGESTWKDIYDSFGESLMESVGLFVNSIIQRGILGNIFLVVKPVELVVQYLLDAVSGKRTRRQKIEEKFPLRIPFGTIYPLILLTTPMCLVYAVICPAILVVGAFYYIVTYLSLKEELIYYYGNEFEQGGECWITCCNHILWALIVFQLGSAARIGHKGGKTMSLALLPLIITTVLYIRSINGMFERACRFYPINILEERYSDKFSKVVNQARIEMLHNWDEFIDEEDPDTLDLEELGHHSLVRDPHPSPYSEPAMLVGYNRIVFPEKFFWMMEFISKNDERNILELKDDQEDDNKNKDEKGIKENKLEEMKDTIKDELIEDKK